jgi:hypothetical protein
MGYGFHMPVPGTPLAPWMKWLLFGLMLALIANGGLLGDLR